MPDELMKERALSLMAASPCVPPDESYFNVLAMGRQPLGASCNLALPEHQAALERHLEGVELLILDNLSTLVNGDGRTTPSPGTRSRAGFRSSAVEACRFFSFTILAEATMRMARPSARTR
jgi:hypothetical protein